MWKSCTDLIGLQYRLDYDYSHFIYFTAAHLIEILLTRNSLHLQTSSKRPDSVDGSVNRSCDLKDKVAGESRQTDVHGAAVFASAFEVFEHFRATRLRSSERLNKTSASHQNKSSRKEPVRTWTGR